jgi:hypothetical protein
MRYYELEMESMGISAFLVIFNTILLRAITDYYVDLLQPMTITSQKMISVVNLAVVIQFTNYQITYFI